MYYVLVSLMTLIRDKALHYVYLHVISLSIIIQDHVHVQLYMNLMTEFKLKPNDLLLCLIGPAAP